jgi:hypothetical protein
MYGSRTRTLAILALLAPMVGEESFQRHVSQVLPPDPPPPARPTDPNGIRNPERYNKALARRARRAMRNR